MPQHTRSVTFTKTPIGNFDTEVWAVYRVLETGEYEEHNTQHAHTYFYPNAFLDDTRNGPCLDRWDSIGIHDNADYIIGEARTSLAAWYLESRKGQALSRKEQVKLAEFISSRPHVGGP